VLTAEPVDVALATGIGDRIGGRVAGHVAGEAKPKMRDVIDRQRYINVHTQFVYRDVAPP
jgi:hypothetical protein